MTKEFDEVAYAEWVASLRNRWPFMFAERCRFEVPVGWGNIVEMMCGRIDEILEIHQVDKKLFPGFVQLKEKFGTGRFYLESGPIALDIMSPDGSRERIDVDIPRDEVTGPSIPGDVMENIREVISAAEAETACTCQECGKQGRLQQGGYLCTLCDEHAMESDKEFPSYGVPVRIRTINDELDGKAVVCSEVIYLQNTMSKVWAYVTDGDKFVFLEDLPHGLVPIVDACPGVRPRTSGKKSIFLHDLYRLLATNSQANPFTQRPEGAKVNLRFRIEEEAHELFGTPLEIRKVHPLMRTELPNGREFAVLVEQPDGARHVLVVDDKEIKVQDWEEIFLRRRIKECLATIKEFEEWLPHFVAPAPPKDPEVSVEGVNHG